MEPGTELDHQEHCIVRGSLDAHNAALDKDRRTIHARVVNQARYGLQHRSFGAFDIALELGEPVGVEEDHCIGLQGYLVGFRRDRKANPKRETSVWKRARGGPWIANDRRRMACAGVA